MQEGRNENLIKKLVSKKAKMKALKITLGLIAFVIACIVIMEHFFPRGVSGIIVLIIVFVPLLIICHIFVTKAFVNAEMEKLNISIVNECLSSDEFTEVIPINPGEHKEFLLSLVDIAKFLAIIDKETHLVKVYAIISGEEKNRYVESLEKAFFLDSYNLLEEKEDEN